MTNKQIYSTKGGEPGGWVMGRSEPTVRHDPEQVISAPQSLKLSPVKLLTLRRKNCSVLQLNKKLMNK
jgi:hypothetical protein